jgi:diacylglycerol kinase (ATP)
MRVVIIHNPKAGDNTHGRDWLLQTAEAYGHEAQYVDSDEDWQQALTAGPDLIAVAGGDGSVDEIARTIAGGSIPLTIVPLGTANNVATKLSLADRPLESLIAGWATGTRCRFDVGVATGRWGTVRFVESVGIGLLADGIADIDTGAATYVNDLPDGRARLSAALDLLGTHLKSCRPKPVRLLVDGEDRSGDYLMVEVMNFGAAGPNLHLSPDAEAGDGLLDVVLVEEADREDLLRRLPMALDLPGCLRTLPVYQGRRVTLTCDDAVMHVDDTLWRLGDANTGTEAAFCVEEGAITILIPGTPF